MSLKAFHIVFVLATLALAAFLTVWLCDEYSRTQARSYLIGAIFSALAGLGTLVYGRYFLKKMRHIPYL